jgi:hypothetical protein
MKRGRILMENLYPNWFFAGGVQNYFERHLSGLAYRDIKCLQIGAYTGDATEWLFEHILRNPDATLTDVDTWEGSDEILHKTMDFSEVEKIYLDRHQEKINSGKLIKFKGTSEDFFKQNTEKYDFIYVDGSHMAADVLKDGINSFDALNEGGILAFDDYKWSEGKGPAFEPKPAIDAIRFCYNNRLNLLEMGLQVWFSKSF